MAARLIHVIRHAHAGDPVAWLSNPDLRPLSTRGCAQADRVAAQIHAPAAIHASPSLRCLATVLPLARANRVAVATLDELYEGGTAAAMLEQLAALRVSPVVACTHGDVIADLLQMLSRAGVALASHDAPKASTWTLEVQEGRVVSARYAPPP